MTSNGFLEFRPHPLLRGGHAQTLAGVYLPWRQERYSAVRHRVELRDGDVVILHDDCPKDWKRGDRVVLLMHGLGGCHLSPYMVRTSLKLCERGIRAFRLDLRNCGAGAGLARNSYHAGRSDDVSDVVKYLEELCPGSPIGVVGYSLSGNIVLNYLGDGKNRVSPGVDRAIVANPPIDLKRCVRTLDRLANRMYDRHFTRLLNTALKQLRGAMPDVEFPKSYDKPRRLYDFDDQYTAPAAGFRDAEDYYTQCSAARHIANIVVPTLIVTSRNDPLVPVATFESLRPPEPVALHIAPGGGHLGYVARGGMDADRRWLDWRVVDWFV